MTPNLQTDKCSANDYRDLFAEAAEPLQWLCFTLTADQKLSEQVLDAALEQSVKGAEYVFRDWMVSWARRLVIKVCIQTVRPWTLGPQGFYAMPPFRLDAVDHDRLRGILDLPSQLLQEKLLQLDPLSRFVFVLRAMESYSRRETSLLLSIDDRACEWIYVRAAAALEQQEDTTQFRNIGWNEASAFAAAGD